MAMMAGILLIAIAIGLVILMIYQHAYGIHPLISLRNFAIVGLIIYQAVSPGRALITDLFGEYPLASPAWTGAKYLLLLLLFMWVFSKSYRKGWFVDRILKTFPVPSSTPSTPTLVVLAVVLTLLGFALRFGVQIPLIGIIAGRWGLAFAAMACGVVGWLWGPRLLNPLVMCFVGVIVAANGINALTDTFGRRPLIAIGGALIWGLFFSAWRYLPIPQLLGRMAAVSIPPILFIGLFTAAREAQEFDRSASEQLSEIGHASLTEGLLDLFGGQSCGPVSMWLIESYPERYEYKHLLALRYLIVFPVPREWWEGKPDPLSKKIAHEASLEGVDDTLLTIGPGIVGQGHAEGGLYSLILYAIIGALILRFGDELVWRHQHNPLTVLAIGSSLGDCTGLSRGETSTFMFNFLITIAGAYLFSLVASRIIAKGAANAPVAAIDYDEEPSDLDPATAP